ncbi:hypothetical protein ACQCRO_27585, partial [Ralstonia pseudosolanacearum]|uniref:hypothetical protein n=1 Tax=Ralstonia pseudosolanacearum TaxID=1310165 RepID=UPI003CEC7D33
LKREVPNQNYRVQMQQIPDSGYVLTSQLDQLQQQQQLQHQHQQQQHLQQQQQQQQLQQQQFINTGTHYIPQQGTGPMPMSSYYQMHPQQQQHPHQQLDSPYPMYYVTVPQNQAYNYPLQSNISETTGIPSSRPPIPPNPSMLPTPAAYKEQPPLSSHHELLLPQNPTWELTCIERLEHHS